MLRRYLLAIFACGVIAGCNGAQSNQTVPPPSQPDVGQATRERSKVQHIVVIVQENRSVDNLFQFLPGASTQSWGFNSYGQRVDLMSQKLTAPYDERHDHRFGWKAEYNQGKFNGFNLDPYQCRRHSRKCPPQSVAAYAYVPQAEVQPYYTMAKTYTFADEFFQTNQGPSFPAHQYLVSGTSTVSDLSTVRAAENPGHQSGGCDSPPNIKVRVITLQGVEDNHKVRPCFDRISIFTRLDKAGISWKYYQAQTGPGLWNAVDALKPIWQNKSEYNANVIIPPAQVITDVNDGNLASVVFVTPTAAASDHAGITDGTGPSWVASVVNAIGRSQYWDTTTILVTWDDWGGWFDHVVPNVRNSYELSFRVPLIVISPYAKQAYVSHLPYEFGSILKFIEETFKLGSLGTTDLTSNDLSDCFDFAGMPHRYKYITSQFDASYFLHLPPDTRNPDDDE